MYAVRETEVIVTDPQGAPLFEGLRLALPSGFVEFGRVLMTSEGPAIGVRRAGESRWSVRAPHQIAGELRPEYYPGEGQPAWPVDDDERALEDFASRVERTFRYGYSASIDDLAWRGASDAWLTNAWPRVSDSVVAGLARSYNDQPVPLVLRGQLTRLDVAGKSAALTAGARPLPPTLAGWNEFLRLAPSSELTFTQLREAGGYWWERKIPRTLLSDARGDRGELPDVPAPPRGRSTALPAVPPPRPMSDTEYLQRAAVNDAMAMAGMLGARGPVGGGPPSRPETLTRAQQTDAARRELGALALRPDRRAYWLAKVNNAIRVGDKWHSILDQAAAEADTATSGTGGFLDAFNRTGTYRVELVREGATGKTYVVSRAFDGRPLATIVTQHPLGGGGNGDEELENILWREQLSPQEQAEITGRFFDTLLFTDTGTLTAEAEEMERRARALGADPARARGPLAEVVGTLGEGEDVEALQDVRPLLYWTAAMVSAPRCLGEVQDASAAAVREAFRLYQVARRRLLAGAPPRAIVASLARVVRAAARLAADCGEGQVTLLGVPLQLQVAPGDRAIIEGAP